jgi:ABC-type lipoprotein export system ATPase subunit
VTWRLDCVGLEAGLGRKSILRADFTFDFAQRGQILPVRGKSGIGKSTLLYVLSALAAPRGGRAVWSPASGAVVEIAEGADVSGFRRKNTGFSLQSAALIPHLTVRENLEWILRLRRPEVGAGERRELADSIVERFIDNSDLSETPKDILAKYPNKLSGGQKGRMALAGAMVHDPDILFADEPTGSLDKSTRQRVLERVAEWLALERKRCFVFVTHNEDDALFLGATYQLEVSYDKVAKIALARDQDIGKL